MTHYALHQRCWPTGSLRAPELQAFLRLLESSCAVSAFELAGQGTITPTTDALEVVLRRALAAAPFPGAGADEDIFARLGAGNEYMRVSIHSGRQLVLPGAEQAIEAERDSRGCRHRGLLR